MYVCRNRSNKWVVVSYKERCCCTSKYYEENCLELQRGQVIERNTNEKMGVVKKEKRGIEF